MKIKVSPFALIDLEESVEYYNLQKESLGWDFAKIVDLSFEMIKSNPKLFPKVFQDVRKVVIDRFSFSIFFIENEDVIYILGIFHTSRNPKTIQKRVKKL